MKTIVKVGIGVAIIVLVIAGAVGWRVWRGRAAQPKTIQAERADLIQEVAFTGRLAPAREVSLGFESIGTVAQILVDVGDAVTAGQVVARLDTTSQQLEVAQAMSQRQLTQAEYEILAGKTAREAGNLKTENNQTLATRRQAVRDAKVELGQAQEIWQQTVRESGDESSTAKAKLLAVQAAESAYHAAQQALKLASATATKTNTSATDAAAVAAAQLRLQEQTYAEQIARVKLSKATLRSPVAGVVTAKNIEVGSVATSSQPAVTVATTNQLEIAAAITEADVAKLKLDQEAKFTLDAYPNLPAQVAKISKIDPAATVIEGVPTYKVTLSITNPDLSWRPGLTANVNSIAARREQVIVLPRRAIIRRGSDQFVRLQTPNGATQEQAVTTGLVGSDGRVEILQGLSGQETIVVPAP